MNDPETNCICSQPRVRDARFQVQCDKCQWWMHGECFGFTNEAEVPETWICTRCKHDTANGVTDGKPSKRSKSTAAPTTTTAIDGKKGVKKEKTAAAVADGSAISSKRKRLTATKPAKSTSDDNGSADAPLPPSKRSKSSKATSSTVPAVVATAAPQPKSNPKSGLRAAALRPMTDAQPHRLLSRCELVLRELTAHPLAPPFNTPVPSEVMGYYESISRPMDFGTVYTNLRVGAYQYPDQFASDIRQVFTNCRAYNEPTAPISQSATTLEAQFERRYAELIPEHLRLYVSLAATPAPTTHATKTTTQQSLSTMIPLARQTLQPPSQYAHQQPGLYYGARPLGPAPLGENIGPPAPPITTTTTTTTITADDTGGSEDDDSDADNQPLSAIAAAAISASSSSSSTSASNRAEWLSTIKDGVFEHLRARDFDDDMTDFAESVQLEERAEEERLKASFDTYQYGTTENGVAVPTSSSSSSSSASQRRIPVSSGSFLTLKLKSPARPAPITASTSVHSGTEEKQPRPSPTIKIKMESDPEQSDDDMDGDATSIASGQSSLPASTKSVASKRSKKSTLSAEEIEAMRRAPPLIEPEFVDTTINLKMARKLLNRIELLQTIRRVLSDVSESTIIERLSAASSSAPATSRLFRGLPDWYHITGPDDAATYDLAILKAVTSIGIGQVEETINDPSFVQQFWSPINENASDGEKAAATAAAAADWEGKKMFLSQFLRDAQPLTDRLKVLIDTIGITPIVSSNNSLKISIKREKRSTASQSSSSSSSTTAATATTATATTADASSGSDREEARHGSDDDDTTANNGRANSMITISKRTLSASATPTAAHSANRTITRDANGRPILPFQAKGGVTVYRLGTLVTDRPFFSKPSYIIPVGYASSRTYPSSRNADVKLTYTSTISDGGSGPIFTVTPGEPPAGSGLVGSEPAVQANTASAAWSEIVARVNAIKVHHKRTKTSVSGPEVTMSAVHTSTLIHRDDCHVCCDVCFIVLWFE